MSIKMGTQVNRNKTIHILIADTNRDLTLEEGMKTIKHTEECKYWGVNITQGGKQDKKIKSMLRSLLLEQ